MPTHVKDCLQPWDVETHQILSVLPFRPVNEDGGMATTGWEPWSLAPDAQESSQLAQGEVHALAVQHSTTFRDQAEGVSGCISCRWPHGLENKGTTKSFRLENTWRSQSPLIIWLKQVHYLIKKVHLGWKEHQEVPNPTSELNPDFYPVSLKNFHGWRLHNLLGSLTPMTDTPHHEKGSSMYLKIIFLDHSVFSVWTVQSSNLDIGLNES